LAGETTRVCAPGSSGDTMLTIMEGRFPGPIRLGWSEGLFSLVPVYASRFRNCICTERNHIGGGRRKWGNYGLRAILRREIYPAQEVLEARLGARQRREWPTEILNEHAISLLRHWPEWEQSVLRAGLGDRTR
jgi:hypothetical protein